VEPLSIDEAFLDLGGTDRLHKAPPAVMLARLVKRIESEVGVTASIGLSYNKFLAKVASDLDKPRGFAVIGRAEATEFLAAQPVGLIWGVGKALQEKLAKDGITHIRQLQQTDERTLLARYGSIGGRLFRFARGEDGRRVSPDAPTKSVSAETTFDTDIGDAAALKARLWPLCEKVSARLKAADLSGRTVVLKLKTRSFRTLTRNRQLSEPTQLAEVLYRSAAPLLEAECSGLEYRLIGVGVAELMPGSAADPDNLLDPDAGKRARVERALDSVRKRLGDSAIQKGRSLESAARRRRDTDR
jgi:DNA polymerase-4